MSHIIPTIGPAISDSQHLTKLYQDGVRILRFNFSHYSPEKAKPILDIVYETEKLVGGKFDLMMDIEGPSIRTGELNQPRLYTKGEKFKLVVDTKNVSENAIFCDYPGILDDVNIGTIVKIESGLFDTIVREKGSNYLLLEALNEFTMISRRHINIPGIHINQPTVTEKDFQDILYAIQEGFRYIAISFCRSAEDIKTVRSFIQSHTTNQIKLIAKIENQEGIDNLDEIVESSDMVMVARGDLGTELPLEVIPEIQMKIVKTCKLKNTPVIVATQMMSSMVDHPAPTRAEVSDIFLAVLEGADYLMLSEETTIGEYPIQTVEMMKRTIESAEKFDK